MSSSFVWRASCRIRTNDPEITNHVLWPTELKRHSTEFLFLFNMCQPFHWSGRRGSNPRPPAWKASALSTELLPHTMFRFLSVSYVGTDGFEPPKAKASRFTVCPIWPLWNMPITLSLFVRIRHTCRETLVTRIGFKPITF